MRHLNVLRTKLLTMLKDENGATMIEYSLMVAFIAMVAVAAVGLVGTNVGAKFDTLAELFP